MAFVVRCILGLVTSGLIQDVLKTLYVMTEMLHYGP